MIGSRVSPYGFQKTNTLKTRAEMKALDPVYYADRLVVTLDDGSRWKFVAASTAVDATEHLVISPAPAAPDVAPLTGRWCRFDKDVDMGLPVSAATADAAVLFTVPVGFLVRLEIGAYWLVDVAFTGGSTPAIGLSSSNAAYATKGDLLGGAAGDLTAGLTAGARRGNPGTKYANGGAVVLTAGDTIRFDRIAGIFAAGSGSAVMRTRVLTAP